MQRESEPTISFRPSQFLVTLEAPPATLAVLLDMLFNKVDRTTWGLSHKSKNRATFAAELRKGAEPSRRLGLSVETEATLQVIERLATPLKIKVFVMRGNTGGQASA